MLHAMAFVNETVPLLCGLRFRPRARRRGARKDSAGCTREQPEAGARRSELRGLSKAKASARGAAFAVGTFGARQTSNGARVSGRRRPEQRTRSPRQQTTRRRRTRARKAARTPPRCRPKHRRRKPRAQSLPARRFRLRRGPQARACSRS
eukprot:Amastigsp_a341765_13.p5 type:complete len:150 gc:universal Amastigsp_a341765_13:569-120(-)